MYDLLHRRLPFGKLPGDAVSEHPVGVLALVRPMQLTNPICVWMEHWADPANMIRCILKSQPDYTLV